MNKVKKYIVSPHSTVQEVIKNITSTGKRCALIVDENTILVGIFTDGDMRNYILSGGDLTANITSAMNKNPQVWQENSENLINKLKKENKHTVYPIVNAQNQLVDAIFWDEPIQTNKKLFQKPQLNKSISTVIMAGGLGKRLHPYTKVLPKALIPIGDLPICTRVINNFKEYGCENFHLVLNHKKNIIKAYYSDEDKDFNLFFHEESKFLGTAGGLALLKNKMQDAFFVSNCDILLEANYVSIYKKHKESNNLITFVGAVKDMEIPYGIIKVDNNGKISLEEKPSFSFLTNVGVYLLEPKVLDYINDDEYIDMPDLITKLIEQGENIGVFPVTGDSWLDMGQIEEMKNMQTILEARVQKKI